MFFVMFWVLLVFLWRVRSKVGLGISDKKNNSADDGIDEINVLFRRNSGYSEEQNILGPALGIPFRGTIKEANFLNENFLPRNNRNRSESCPWQHCPPQHIAECWLIFQSTAPQHNAALSFIAQWLNVALSCLCAPLPLPQAHCWMLPLSLFVPPSPQHIAECCPYPCLCPPPHST
jgi:hypothetical protein